ncbi:hypothetical protein E2C01_028473 [Portunus trituberculatus]|uniref:Uncharacterized protein n=1 Tax=Portunus trituberculatus TaxID=210409 RepID=A0A5B7ELM5_PORTR|nr:hypothetical protein [Portunus trituberculatus]
MDISAWYANRRTSLTERGSLPHWAHGYPVGEVEWGGLGGRGDGEGMQPGRGGIVAFGGGEGGTALRWSGPGQEAAPREGRTEGRPGPGQEAASREGRRKGWPGPGQEDRTKP